MQNMIWIVTHRKNSFLSASAQSLPKLQKDDGRYPNRLAFLITDCNLFVSVSDKNSNIVTVSICRTVPIAKSSKLVVYAESQPNHLHASQH